MIDAAPAHDGQLAQPDAASGEQVGRRLALARDRLPGGAGAAQRRVQAGEQRVVHRAEQRGPGAGQRRQMLVRDGARAHLLHGLAHAPGQRGARQRARQGGQRRRRLLADPGEPVGERRVEPGHHVQRRAGPCGTVRDQLTQLYVEHQRTAPVAGNQCSSVSGSVLSGTSR